MAGVLLTRRNDLESFHALSTKDASLNFDNHHPYESSEFVGDVDGSWTQ